MEARTKRSTARPKAGAAKPNAGAANRKPDTKPKSAAANSKAGTKPRPCPANPNTTAKPGVANGKPTAQLRPSATNGVKPPAINLKPGSKPKLSSTANAKPSAAVQAVSVRIGKPAAYFILLTPKILFLMSYTEGIHVKVVQSIQDAAKAMSKARATVEKAKGSKRGQNMVVFRASGISTSLLAPSRQVVKLLAEHGAVFPPCKQLSKSLAVCIP